MIIETPSRLHITLIDLNGSSGRIDGGVGLTLKEPQLVLEMEPAADGIGVRFQTKKKISYNLIGDYEEKIKTSARSMVEYLQLEGGWTFTVHENFPSHSGLGSGTQLSLAAGKLLADFDNRKMDAAQIASIVGRGGTSGIGVASFENGGFIIDGGHQKGEKPQFLPSSASNASPPPIIARYDFPDHWKVVLVIPDLQKNVSGKKEVNIFQEYCPIPLNEVQKLSHIILMKLMPSIIEQDIDVFGEAVNSIQDIGFKKVENQLQDPLIGHIMASLRDAGASGVGMSSFGPTIYAITDSPRDIVAAANDALNGVGGHIIETTAQNYGATCR